MFKKILPPIFSKSIFRLCLEGKALIFEKVLTNSARLNNAVIKSINIEQLKMR